MDPKELSSIFQPFYIQVAAISWFYYDYFLTFAAEVSHVWPQPLSLNTFLFFCNRYISFWGNIVVSILLFAPISNSTERSVLYHHCSSFIRVREALLVSSQVAVVATLSTRTIALYGRSRAIIIVVVSFGLFLLGVTCWTLVASQQTTGTQYILSVPGCRYFMSEKSAIHSAAAWEASALLDIFIFALTLAKTLKILKTYDTAISSWAGLLDLILRDGALYFFVMALANSANILSFYLASGPFKGTFTTPASCIASTLCSRLVLNLYDAAPQDGTTDSDYPPEPKSTSFLTTHIELGVSMDYDGLSEVESTWE